MKRYICFIFVVICVSCSKEVFLPNAEAQNVIATESFTKTFPNLLNDYQISSGKDALYRVVNGAYAVSQFSRLFNFSDGRVSHDATLVVVNGYAYAVYAFDNEGSDSAYSSTCKVRLKRVNLSDPTEFSEYTIAQKGRDYNGLMQTGGAGEPNMFLVDGVLHIVYLANIDYEYVMMHTTFNINTLLFGNYSKCTLANNGVGRVLTENTLDIVLGRKNDGEIHGFQMNSSIGVSDGVYYFGLAYNNIRALIIRTVNFVDFEYFTTMDFGCDVYCEVACWCKDGYLYASKRLPYLTNDSGKGNNDVHNNNDGLAPLAKYDIKKNKWISAVSIKNCSTRPTFFECNGIVYCVTCGPTRANGQIIAIDNERLENSKIVLEIDDDIMNYPSFSVSDESIYVIGTADISSNIPLYKLELAHYSKEQIEEVLLNKMKQ